MARANLPTSVDTSINVIRAALFVRSDKKSPNQETGLGNRGHLKVLNDTKLVLTAKRS